jgi:hypothetical protein
MHTIVVGRGKGPERLLEGESARVTAVESAYAMYLGKHHHQAVESPTYEERERDSGKRDMRGRWGGERR